MNAAEMLAKVKALPPRERRKFMAGLRELGTTTRVRPTAARGVRVRWPDATERHRRIVGDRVLPNLVLLAREEDGY